MGLSVFSIPSYRRDFCHGFFALPRSRRSRPSDPFSPLNDSCATPPRRGRLFLTGSAICGRIFPPGSGSFLCRAADAIHIILGESNVQLAIITAQQVLILFLLILAGFACGKTGALQPEGKKVLSDLLLYLVVPAMIVDSYLVEFDPATFRNLLSAFGLSALLLFLGLAVTYLVTWRLGGPDRAILRFACGFSNAGYMGMPLIRALFGSEGLLYASAFLTVFNILIWTVGYVMVSGQVQPKAILRSIVTCPAVLAVAAGLGLYLARVPVPQLLSQPIGLMGDMNTPISMVITGLTIAGSDLNRLMKNRRLLLVLAVRMVLVPLVGFGLFALLGLHGMVANVVLILEACPSAAITTVFAVRFGHNEDLAAGSVVFTTLLSILTLPLYALLLAAML